MKPLLPITLMAQRGNWQQFKKRSRLKKFAAVEKHVLQRDDYQCAYCGFQSEKYQVVINKNHNYGPGNSKPDNLVTACKFCAQCFFLDGIGKDDRSGGYIIYLPEISQADLGHFCRVLFSSMLRDAPYKGKLQTAYLSLKDRSKTVEELFGPGSSSPNVFGQTLIDCHFSAEQLQNPILSKLRLLPDRKFFAPEINYWKSTIFDQIPL